MALSDKKCLIIGNEFDIIAKELGEVERGDAKRAGR